MGTKKPESWRTFEDAFRAIVSQHRKFFGLETVDPGPGKAQGETGYVWNIEVIGYTAGQRKMVLFEVRRKTTRNIEPGEASELAYRIEDIGAEKGYFVTPLDRKLSRGAKKIADFEEIGHVQISVTSTPENYVMRSVDQVFVGATDKIELKDAGSFEVMDKDGNVICRGHTE
jgi:hypothetical protein